MPGIHVHTLSQLDWLDEEKKSLLTIPGSYWLCHKKNIYKFIFRYHRSMKNTTQFSYGRELLKIIRRIIKYNPTQGQQFGTQHLLVTYNCTSWTRQDKMFAILKFQQRTNAATFSHAFVLTIKILPSSLVNLKYPVVRETKADTIFEDLDDPTDIEEKTTTRMRADDKMSLRKSAICQDKKIDKISKSDAIENTLNKTETPELNSSLQENIEMSVNFYENLDVRIKNASASETEKHFINRHNAAFHDNMIHTDQSINCNTVKKFEKNAKHPINHKQKQFFTTKKKTENKIEKVNSTDFETKNETQKQSQATISGGTQKYKIFSSSKPPIAGILKNNVNIGCNFDEITIEKEHIHAIKHKSDLDHTKNDENNLDISNVSCQYFIEKEIENTSDVILPTDISMRKNLRQDTSEIEEIEDIKKNEDLTPELKSEINKSLQEDNYNEIFDFKSLKSDKQHIVVSTNVDDNPQPQNNIYFKSAKVRSKQKNRESEKKIITDDKILRSSDITDLVMEGLMFTIRQDQDSVAVIEQKTKLEVDEVLENSEKVETKGGEKCLLNSSLLRLENMVTMIDSPHNKDERHKSNYMTNSSAYSSPFNIFTNDPVYNLGDINYVNKTMDKLSVPSYDKYETIDQNSCSSSWQHQDACPSIANGDNCTNKGNIKNEELLMDWHDSDNVQDKTYTHINDIELEKEKKDQKKNITLEDLQSTIFSSEETNAGLQDEDLSTNNMNIEKIKYDTYMKEHNISLSLHSLSSSSKTCTKEISTISEEPKSKKEEMNLPRVISNKAITVDQIPLALQKVLRQTCKTRNFSSITGNGILLAQEQKTQCISSENATVKMDVSLEREYIDLNTVNESSSTVENHVENSKNDKNESRVTIDKNNPENNSNPCEMIIPENSSNSCEKNNETYHTSQTSTSMKHDSLRKLQDITEEFYHDLHIHSKDNDMRQKHLRQKRKFSNSSDDFKNGKVRIEMLKFIQDMTEGAKVIVTRLNINNKCSVLEKNSTLTYSL